MRLMGTFDIQICLVLLDDHNEAQERDKVKNCWRKKALEYKSSFPCLSLSLAGAKNFVVKRQKDDNRLAKK